MRNRFYNADAIWNGGASNPRAVARALVEAIDEAVEEKNGSAGAKDAELAALIKRRPMVYERFAGFVGKIVEGKAS